ncbi:hypothetical protein ABZW18_15085 [Streptomyces sp. NPDC004647]|uniref:hypothetical protein n=1 Tax=Streptomyces sp. NPDC004647 TaxID=3154671 RepID=UPI0033AFC532
MSSARETAATNERPQLGALVKDVGEGNRVGVVMGYQGPYVQLRPVGGGKEWDAEPDRVRPLTAREELSVRLAERNEGSRWGK